MCSERTHNPACDCRNLQILPGCLFPVCHEIYFRFGLLEASLQSADGGMNRETRQGEKQGRKVAVK